MNPVIGEVFQCHWDIDSNNNNNSNGAQSGHASRSCYIAEQLSHHPPHTAFCYYNVDQGVAVHADITPSYAKFWGNSTEVKVSVIKKISVWCVCCAWVDGVRGEGERTRTRNNPVF